MTVARAARERAATEAVNAITADASNYGNPLWMLQPLIAAVGGLTYAVLDVADAIRESGDKIND